MKPRTLAKSGFAALLAAALSCCSKPAEVLTIRGNLDANTLTALQQVKWNRVARVDVSSTGGDAAGAIAVARYLKSVGKPIHVRDYCVSACFNIIVIDKGVTVESGTLVALHHSLTSLKGMTQTAYPKISRAYEQPAELEASWYRENGVDPALLAAAQKMIETDCVSGPATDDPAQLRDVRYHATFEMWVPSMAFARASGIKASGAWITDAGALSAYVASHQGADLSHLRFGDPDAAWQRLSGPEKVRALASGPCSAAVRESLSDWKRSSGPVVIVDRTRSWSVNDGLTNLGD